MPQISTHSPSWSCALVTSIRYAVSYTSGKAAAVSKSIPSSRGNTFASGTAISSQWVPSVCSPITVIRPSCSRPGLITTRSPVSTRTPAPSAPRIRGFGTEGKPIRTQRSRWFSDAARSETSTSPGPATGSGTSSYRSTSGPPSSWMRIAFTGTILS